MKKERANRRKFIKDSVTTAAGLVVMSALPKGTLGGSERPRGNLFADSPGRNEVTPQKSRIRFSVIGINHDHIHSQVGAVTRGGGQLVSFYAKEPDLAAAFAKRYPQAKLARNENEIIEDGSIQLILSSTIPDGRAPLGIEVMHHGKDYMSDKPGIISLEQLTEVRRVQKETRRIYSIMYSERFENAATVKAGELVKAGAIGKVIQTVGLGPHRMNLKTRPEWFFHRKRYGGIICDIGSPPAHQFFFFSRSRRVHVVAL